MEASDIDQDPGALRRALLLFAETALRPIIRILLRYGLSYPEFNQISRKLYVDTVMNEAEFRIPQRRRQYKARVACLTGLSRKEVLRLVSAERAVENPELESYNRAARVLEGWWTDERFLDDKGRPVALPFRAAPGRRSFSALVADYSGDIPPRAVLDELRRAGVCDASGDDEVHVLKRHYMAREFDVDVMISTAMRIAAALARIDSTLTPAENIPTQTYPPISRAAS